MAVTIGLLAGIIGVALSYSPDLSRAEELSRLSGPLSTPFTLRLCSFLSLIGAALLLLVPMNEHLREIVGAVTFMVSLFLLLLIVVTIPAVIYIPTAS